LRILLGRLEKIMRRIYLRRKEIDRRRCIFVSFILRGWRREEKWIVIELRIARIRER
jgi:hypothetical protein